MKKIKSKKCINFEEIKREECEYLSESELPVLVLAVHKKYNLKKRREWKAIAHQTAGHGCNQHYMMGTILEPKPETLTAMLKIEKYWLDSDCGAWGGVSLDEILEYRKQLNKLLGIDCNESYRNFEEGIYPIDCSAEVVRKLCTDKLPKDFDSFIRWRNNSEKVCGVIGRWHLYILGENCD